jgi:hypothetical protein
LDGVDDADDSDRPFIAVERPADLNDVEDPLGDADYPAEDVDVVDEDSTSDFGDPESWDPHAGLKPSEVDGDGSDGDLESEDTLPYGAEDKVNGEMVDMMIDNEGWDGRDGEWLPPNEQRKQAARKKGMSWFASRKRR